MKPASLISSVTTAPARSLSDELAVVSLAGSADGESVYAFTQQWRDVQQVLASPDCAVTCRSDLVARRLSMSC